MRSKQDEALKPTGSHKSTKAQGDFYNNLRRWPCVQGSFFSCFCHRSLLTTFLHSFSCFSLPLVFHLSRLLAGLLPSKRWEGCTSAAVRRPGPGEGLGCRLRRAASKPVSPSQEFLSKETEGLTDSPDSKPNPVRIGKLKTYVLFPDRSLPSSVSWNHNFLELSFAVTAAEELA